MPATAKCPHCGLEMDLPGDLAGSTVECPGCTKSFKSETEKPANDPNVTRCPKCKIEMDLPLDLQGGEVECPGCNTIFVPAGTDDWADEFDRPRRTRRYGDDGYDDDDYDLERRSPERRRAAALARLKPAAIALMICAVVRMLIAGAFAVFGGMEMIQGGNPSSLIIAAVCGVLFIKETITIYGAWLMMNGRSYAWGLVAGILMLIPTCDYCLWLFYMGFGIWAIVAVNDTDVRWYFRHNQKAEREMEQS